MLILVLNCGSSSVKYQLYDMPSEKCLAGGSLEEIGKKIPSHAAAVKLIITQRLKEQCAAASCIDKISAVGHRVVHGGERLNKTMRINAKVLSVISEYSELAPLHNPPNLAGIYAVKRMFSRMPQVAVFDTAFHQTIPECAHLYGLPYKFYQQYGIRRYGFHGTSHRYILEQSSKVLRKSIKQLKIISCHLGNGCSITAIDKGKSVDTSMGFTPLEGLVMGTRCGDIDPAAVLYLIKKRKLSIAQTDVLLNNCSGLLGLSGLSNDMRDLLRAARKGNKRASLAIEVFIYRVKKYIASYVGIMNGADAIVFTAGIGENQPYIRRKVSRGLSSLIKKFRIRVLVIPTNEELMIARDTYRLVKKR